MARLSKDDYNSVIKALLGDRTDDEALSIIENLTDSYNDVDVSEYEAKISALESKLAEADARFNENDEAWRKRYRDRFYSGTDEEANPANQPGGGENDSEVDVAQERAENITIDDLFTE